MKNNTSETPSTITKGDAEKIANILLSYDEINNFKFDKGTINYDLFVLTSNDNLKTGDKIEVDVNLIHTNGTRDSDATTSLCEVKEPNKNSVRIQFSCTINNLKGDYYSLRYNNSVNISGVPNDEILLDPVLTKKYAKPSSVKKDIPSFTYESINSDSCMSTGVFTLSGKFSEALKDSIKFNLPLTYPDLITLLCEVNKGENIISCKVDREITNSVIIIEQTLIKQDDEDYFILKSIKSDKELTCSNGALEDSKKKESNKISFRQVSHFNKNNNGFSFIFVSLVSKEMKKGEKINMNIYVNNIKEDRQIECKDKLKLISYAQ